MKILILGAHGMAGHMISIYLAEQGHDVTGYARVPLNFLKNYIIGDAFCSEHLKRVILNGEYDAIINCIGLLNKFADNNPLQAIFINSYLPHFIADMIRNSSTKFIQLSTDCVFSGENGPYIEKRIPNGESIYDRTKSLGEICDTKNLTFRNSIIGPDINENGIGLFNWFMKQDHIIHGYKNVIWSGITTLTLAQAIEPAITEKITGVYHLVNNEFISKFDLLSILNKYFKNNQVQILPNESVVSNKTLINTRNDFSFEVPSYEEMIANMRDWILSHKYLYNYQQ